MEKQNKWRFRKLRDCCGLSNRQWIFGIFTSRFFFVSNYRKLIASWYQSIWREKRALIYFVDSISAWIIVRRWASCTGALCCRAGLHAGCYRVYSFLPRLRHPLLVEGFTSLSFFHALTSSFPLQRLPPSKSVGESLVRSRNNRRLFLFLFGYFFSSLSLSPSFASSFSSKGWSSAIFKGRDRREKGC